MINSTITVTLICNTQTPAQDIINSGNSGEAAVILDRAEVPITELHGLAVKYRLQLQEDRVYDPSQVDNDKPNPVCFVSYGGDTQASMAIHNLDGGMMSTVQLMFVSMVMGIITLQVTFYEDPGHGWLQVPKQLIHFLALGDQISTCSYQDHDYVYLEEDLDAGIFLNAAANLGIKYKIYEVHQEATPIRNMASYEPLRKHA
jgi:hypothetical protein